MQHVEWNIHKQQHNWAHKTKFDDKHNSKNKETKNKNKKESTPTKDEQHEHNQKLKNRG